MESLQNRAAPGRTLSRRWGTKGCDSGIESRRQLGRRLKRMLGVADLGCQPDTPGKQELQLRRSLHQTGLGHVCRGSISTANW